MSLPWKEPDMGWKDIRHRVEVVLGTDEDKTVADEAAEELAKEAEKKDKGDGK
jgi:hypothetical protein